LKIGDKFFTIAYFNNPRVIEAEVIDTENINGVEMIHIQNVEKPYDKWYISVEPLCQWKFATRDEAEKKLSEY